MTRLEQFITDTKEFVKLKQAKKNLLYRKLKNYQRRVTKIQSTTYSLDNVNVSYVSTKTNKFCSEVAGIPACERENFA